MSALPTDVANQALDAAAVDYTLGDIEEGTREAQVTLRAYGECLRQLLRGCPWDFARREAPLELLADASGQTLGVGNSVPSGFQYSYTYPGDCARVRYIPWTPGVNPGAPTGNIQPPNPGAPIMTGIPAQLPTGGRPRPARFLISNDPNYPPPAGMINWETQGVSPQGRLVIATNVQNARCIYTTTVLYPSVWDHLFRAAMVAYLASEISLPLAKDKKFGMEMMKLNISRAKEKIQQARIADGNEMVASSSIPIDWMNARHTGGPGRNGWDFGGAGDCGCWGGGWAGSISFGDGSAY
jgi:hypothetical protein